MQRANVASDAITMQLPHTVRTFPPAREPIAPFGRTPSLVSSGFVERLLERSARGDTTYDPELAYVLSVVSGWSYSDCETLANRLKYYGLPFSSVDGVAVTNPAMLIVSSAYFVRSACGRVGVLSFRGTEPVNALNWLGNLDWSTRPFTGGHIHSGFYANLQAVWDDVHGRLAAAVAPRTSGDGPSERAPMQALYLTGHSLGGAMAVLTAAKIFAENEPVAPAMVRGIYTYGQPAVGDQAFAAHSIQLFGSVLKRHVYARDVVPHMPPRSGGRYMHFGETRISASPDEPWSPASESSTAQARLMVAAVIASMSSYVARRIHLLSRLPFKYSVEDHSPARYIEASRSALLSRVRA